MSISLNNINDRVIRLEGNPHITKLLTLDSSTVGLNHQLTPTWVNYDYLWFFIDLSRKYTTQPPEQGLFKSCNLVPVKALQDIAPVSFVPSTTYFDATDIQNLKQCEWIICEVANRNELWFKYPSLEATAYTDNRIHVFGILTKYYFVRNNIYYIGEQMLKYWLHLCKILFNRRCK